MFYGSTDGHRRLDGDWKHGYFSATKACAVVACTSQTCLWRKGHMLHSTSCLPSQALFSFPRWYHCGLTNHVPYKLHRHTTSIPIPCLIPCVGKKLLTSCVLNPSPHPFASGRVSEYELVTIPSKAKLVNHLGQAGKCVPNHKLSNFCRLWRKMHVSDHGP